MDNDHLSRIISRFGILKYKYLGSFPADMIPEIIPHNTFFICNTDTSKRPGVHWVMVANCRGKFFFGDSLGNLPTYYKTIQLNPKKSIKVLNRLTLQKRDLCGLYCIYFAYCLFSNFLMYDVNDIFILKFFAEVL